MSNNNNQLNIPQAWKAMDRFKMLICQEVGVNLTNGHMQKVKYITTITV